MIADAARTNSSLNFTSPMSPKTSFTRFIFILVDGSPYQIFKDLVNDGTLSNIKKYVIDRGSFKKTVSTFPSATGPAFIPFFMGLFPGTANVPGLRWLSKRQFQNPHRFRRPGICSYMGLDGLSFTEDLPPVPTLFDFFSPVSNIYNLLTRGCPPARNRTRWVKPFVYTYAHFSHRWRFVNTIASRKLLKAVKAGDEFVMCLFPGVDTFSHLSHTTSDRVHDTYLEIDRTVGKVCQILQESNDFDKTLILITSDHGMSNTHSHIDIPRHLDNVGLRCLHYPLLWRQKVVSASMVSGNGMAHVYFKGKNVTTTGAVDKLKAGWGERLAFEDLNGMGAIDPLLEIEGLDFVAGQSENNSIVVKKKTGEGKITRKNGAFSYKFRGTDPLGYGRFYEDISYREALSQTYDTEYPDGLVQLWQIFKGDRTGDLVLSAQPGYDLRARYEIPEHHATHGALHAQQILVPLAINVPIETEHIRTVDLFPTVLRHLGHAVNLSEIDGLVVR